MKYEIVHPNPNDSEITLACYIIEESPEMPINGRDAMLVLPGGGYATTSDREAEPIALQYLAAGLNVFVLRYSCGKKAKFPAPLIDASYAMKYIRDNAQKLNIAKNRVFAVGFSAGGHLCASLATFWNADFLLDKMDIENGINRPDGVILGYPVIDFGEFADLDLMTVKNALENENPSDEERAKYTIYSHVGAQNPPAFLWHTFYDNDVPVENSLLMAKALADNKIPFEMHIYPHGPHGMALATKQTWANIPQMLDDGVAEWVRLSIKWLSKI